MSASSYDRRRFLRTATAGAAATVVGVASVANSLPASAAPLAPTSASGKGEGARGGAATFRWLGTSGWRIDIGRHTVLVDPYLSRYDTGLFKGAFDPATEISVNQTVIDAYVGRPELVLVTHSHWDHFNDVPYIATSTDARVIGTMTTYNLALASGVKSGQLSPVKGGEVLDFGDYVVEVLSSLHSRNASYSMAFPGVRLDPPTRPRTIADLPEGDTLAFQVTVKGGPRVFFMGASDFNARNLAGLAPDVAMIAVASTDSTHAYVPRLLAALDWPATVVPVHWDNFEVPLQNPPAMTPKDKERFDLFVAAVRKVAPRTEIVIPEYATPYRFS